MISGIADCDLYLSRMNRISQAVACANKLNLQKVSTPRYLLVECSPKPEGCWVLRGSGGIVYWN